MKPTLPPAGRELLDLPASLRSRRLSSRASRDLREMLLQPPVRFGPAQLRRRIRASLQARSTVEKWIS